MLDESFEIECPYCGASIPFTPDISGGKRQTLYDECTVCDKPIRIEVEFDGDEVVRLEAHQESE